MKSAFRLIRAVRLDLVRPDLQAALPTAQGVWKARITELLKFLE